MVSPFPQPSPQDSTAPEQYYPHQYPPENKSPAQDALYTPHPDPIYPPLPAMYQSDSATNLRPSLTIKTTSTARKPSTTSIDLESTIDDTPQQRSYQDVKVSAPSDETGIKALLWPNATPCRAYLIAVLAETIVNILIEVIILLQLNDLAESVPSTAGGTVTKVTRQPVYLGIFVLAHVLQMVLAIDAVYNKNTLQFVFLAVFNFSLMAYGCMQVVEIRANLDSYRSLGASLNASVPINVLTISVPIITAIAEVAYVALGWQIWKEFGWKLYKFLGADIRIRHIYAQYQIFQCFLKFDIFFWVGFGVQWISLVLRNNDFEFYLTLVALPLSVLLLIQGHIAARHEKKWVMSAFMVGCAAGVAYFTYKAYVIISERKKSEMIHLWKSLLIFACMSIFLLVTTFIWACIVMNNFDRGLKDNMNKKQEEHKLERKATVYKGGKGAPTQMAFNPKRMSIE